MKPSFRRELYRRQVQCSRNAVHQVILSHSSAVALFTAEPAVLWLCRRQDGKDAVGHFQKQAKKANEKRDGLFPLEPSLRRDLYYQKGIQLGLDGSIVDDGMTVYVPDWMSMELPHPMQEIDYFHGMCDGHAVCQTMEDEDLYDINMLNPDVGFVAFNIRKIQRLFRPRRP